MSNARGKSGKITTHYDPPPIPIRTYDWSAWRGDPDLDMLIGHGETEQAALHDLLDSEWEGEN